MMQFPSSIPSAVANHLWQSTVFAAAVWLMTLLLSRNAARVRFSLWFAASIKFLVPFSLLVGLGGLLPRHGHTVVQRPTAVYFAIDAMGLPFANFNPTANSSAHRTSFLDGVKANVPAMLAEGWLCGAAVVLTTWCVRWRKLRGQLRRAILAVSGREFEILKQMKGSERISLMLSRVSMEPGIFQVFRPVLIWPEQLSEQLEDAHIEAIMAHELMHVRRHDNLTAAMHMLVEAAFWFHPVVWWIERRLLEERERACDEAVVEMGGSAETYAESLLKACRFCVESPMMCVAGITSADLCNRIRSIMTSRAERLGVARKSLLASLLVATVAGPVMFGTRAAKVIAQQTTAADTQKPAGGQIAFEVASVKQNKTEISPSNLPYTNFPIRGDAPNGNHLVTRNFQLLFYIQLAYKNMTASQLKAIEKQLPDWARNDRFDIEARADGEPTKDQIRTMVQSLLAERFQWVIHFENREVPVFALTLVKPGTIGQKLRPHSEGQPCDVLSPSSDSAKKNPSPIWPPACHMMLARGTQGQGLEMGYRDATMDQFAGNLTFMGQLDRPVVDRTGLSGTFDLTLQWTPEPGSVPLPPGETLSHDVEVTTLQEGLKEQLGLKLEAAKATMPLPVIDHVERPSVN